MLRYIINRYTVGFVFLALIAVILVNATGEERPDLTLFENIIKTVVTPIESGVSKVVRGVSDTFGTVFAIGSIKDDNEKLKDRVAALEAENLLLREYGYQNLRLRELLKFKDTVGKNYEMVSASVVGRNPSNWFKTVTINRGESDGIQKNMVVMTSLGLVGHVINVSSNAAEVVLIVESSSAVGGLIQVTRTPGVVEGLGDNSGYLKMRYLAKDAPIREKQVIVSSGLGGIYPKGVPIGRVVKVETESNGLEKYAILEPFVDFNLLEEVFVIKTVFRESDQSLSYGGE